MRSPVQQQVCRLKTSGAAARQRAYRRRKRTGQITVSIEVNQWEIADLLVEQGLLPQWDSEDRAKVRAAFEAGLRSGKLRITGFAD
jgi:hypothetical protein